MIVKHKIFIYSLFISLLGWSCSNLEYQMKDSGNTAQALEREAAVSSEKENQELVVVSGAEDSECAICLEPLNALVQEAVDKKITIIEGCSHVFHQSCIFPAMKAQYTLKKKEYEEKNPGSYRWTQDNLI
jgi:hypothetical protein